MRSLYGKSLDISSSLVQGVGRPVIKFHGEVRGFFSYLIETLRQMATPPFRFRQLIQQMEFVGNQSLGIVALSAFFVGAVFALQIGLVFKLFRAEGIMGAATGKALARELAPMLTGFLLAGRAGAAMTSEIATMKVSEQIDAMEAMAVEPIHYLVVPRVLATTFMAPLLSGIFVLVGEFGAFAVGIALFDVDQGAFLKKIMEIVKAEDIWSGLQKALFFGMVIGLMACYYGLRAKGGAKGVGMATTNSVVMTLLMLLIVDFIVTFLQVNF